MHEKTSQIQASLYSTDNSDKPNELFTVKPRTHTAARVISSYARNNTDGLIEVTKYLVEDRYSSL